GIHVDRVFDAIAKMHPHAVTAVRAQFGQMGLGGLRGITSTGRVDGAGVAATTTVHVDGKRTGLSRLFSVGEPAKLGTLRFAPKSTLYCAAGNFDLKELWDTITEVGGMAVTMGVEVPFKQNFGLDLRADLIDAVGPEGALIVASNRGLIPDVALVLECREPERLQKAMLTLLRGVKWPKGAGVTTMSLAGGLKAYSVPLGHRRLADFPIAPTFGMVDGHLVVTPYPMSFQRIVAVYRGESPRLSQNPDFQKLKKKIPRNALAMSYLDLVRVLEIFYDTAVPLFQSMPNELAGGLTPIYELPDVGLFSRHLFGRVGWRVADDKGMHWHSYSSIDTSGMMVGMVAGGLGGYFLAVRGAHDHRPAPDVDVATPVKPPLKQMRVKVEENRRKVQLMHCGQRVRRWRVRLQFYYQEHRVFPKSLAAVTRKGDDKKMSVCPGGESYVYLGPAGKNGILLHGHANGPDGQVTILTTRLVVRRIPPETLKKRLSSRPGR
ncbi:MAG: hypothetical protein OER88_14675, partial [Planctomycetota bacterium]|nr:hypothetical protein [Planctomycetota bacterium]